MEQRLNEYRNAQEKDPVWSNISQAGWLAKHTIESELIPHWKVSSSLTLCEGLLLYDNRIVVPSSLQGETVSHLHEGHQAMHREVSFACVSASVIDALKTLFARHGIPEVLCSYNSPQYSAEEFAQFVKSYDICHITSSPRYPQSNGHVERTVQTMKRILKKSDVALLNYRATPLQWCNLSPSELLLMGRRLWTTLPQTTSKLLISQCPYLPQFKRADKDYKCRTRANFDHQHGVVHLPKVLVDQMSGCRQHCSGNCGI